MAIYPLQYLNIKRRQGRSAVAAAAYRSGQKLTDEWDGITHDYTKKGGVVHSEIFLPAHAPPEFSDRSTLWNSVEQMEKAATPSLPVKSKLLCQQSLTGICKSNLFAPMSGMLL